MLFKKFLLSSFLIFAVSSCRASCGLEILLQCRRHNERGKERVCRASWKYEPTKGRERLPSTSLCPCTIWKSLRENLALRLSLPPHLLHALLSPSLYFPSPSFLSFSFRPLAQRLILHAQEQTEISIQVMPHSLATPTNGSMQLGCTHSKRPFEYSSANSCIHWYLKCSGSARALNPWYIWQNPPQKKKKKKQRRLSGTRIKTVFIVRRHQILSGELRLACLPLLTPQKMKASTLSTFTATHW